MTKNGIPAARHSGTPKQEIKKRFPIFLRPFFQNAGREESRQRSISEKNQKKFGVFEI